MPLHSGKRLIAEDVIAWGEHDGDLYYNVYAGDPDTPTMFYPFDSGDLYMYDHYSMASSLIVSDCGADINAIADVSDEYILLPAHITAAPTTATLFPRSATYCLHTPFSTSKPASGGL